MTPAARAAAAIGVLDRVLDGAAVEPALIAWARGSRYAGSGDRAAVRDLVFDALRRRRSWAALGGSDDGRGLILGRYREAGTDPGEIFGAAGYAPAALSPDERAAGRLPDADEATDLPDWLLAALRSALGPDFGAIAAAMRERAPVWLRTNRLRATPDEALAALSAAGITAEPDAATPDALRVTDGARHIARSDAYHDGLVELQDLSPQRAVSGLGHLDGLSVLDYCAGGGGKALALAAAGAARVLAHDADPARMTDLPARAHRAGARIEIVPPGAVTGRFDLVVTDVPCSGSGSWRRDPAGRWRLTADRLADLIATQSAILDAAAKLVAPGGRLAYMTCSLLPAENGAQIAAFLNRDRRFHRTAELTMTPLTASDGFFAATMVHGRH